MNWSVVGASTVLALALFTWTGMANAATTSPIYVVGHLDRAHLGERDLIAIPSDTTYYRRVFKFFADANQNVVLVEISDLRTPGLGAALLNMAAGMGMRVLALITGLDRTPLTPAGMGVAPGSAQWQALLGYRVGEPNADAGPGTTGLAALRASDPTKIVTITHEPLYLSTLPSYFPPLPAASLADYLNREMYFVQSRPTDNQLFNNLVNQMAVLNSAGVNTYWSLGMAWDAPDPIPPADLQHLERMALWPALLGATGHLWWRWSEFNSDAGDAYLNNKPFPGEAVHAKLLVRLSRFQKLAAVDHYLGDVVGPAVMGRTWIGQFQGAPCGGSYPNVPCSENTVPGGNRELLYSLSDNVMAGAFRLVRTTYPGTDNSYSLPDTSYTLFVGNRSESTINAAVTLKGPVTYEVGIAPSIVGYTAPSGYDAVTVYPSTITPANHNDHLSTFYLNNLGPGEVRVLRVNRPYAAPNTVHLLNDLTANTLSPGQSVGLMWTGLKSGIKIRFYPDLMPGPGLAGPYVLLAFPPDNATSASITIPSLTTTRGHVEVSGMTAQNEAVRISHQGSIRVAVNSADALSPVALRSTTGYLFSDLTMGSDGLPRVVSMTDWSLAGNLKLHSLVGGAWNTAGIFDSRTAPNWGPAPTSQGVGAHGLHPRVLVGPDGVVHAAYFTVFQTDFNKDEDGDGVWDSTGLVLRYQRKVGTTWTLETIDSVGFVAGGCDMVLGSDGQPWIAYNGGPWRNYALRLKHRQFGPDGNWHWVTVADSHDDMLAQSLTTDVNSQAADVSMVLAKDESDQNVLHVAFLSRRSGQTTLVKHDMLSGHGWQSQFVLGGGKFFDLAVSPSGYPALATAVGGTVPHANRIIFKTIVLDPSAGLMWGPNEFVDVSVMNVSGLALAFVGGLPSIVYAANGALLESKWDPVTSTWTKLQRDVVRDAEGPVGFGANGGQDRWYTYWDKKNEALMVATVPGPNNGGGDDDGGGNHEDPAIALESGNPVMNDRRLMFSLRVMDPAEFKADLIDVSGRRAASFRPVAFGVGSHRQAWQIGGGVPSGVYFVRAWLGDRLLMQKRLVLVR